MRKNALFALVLLVAALTAAPAHPANAAAPLCKGAQADKWLDSPGTLTGTGARDVLVGSAGADRIFGLGGNDLICTAPDGVSTTAGDYIEAGQGDDEVLADFSASDTVYGGSGDDTISTQGLVDGGSGRDIICCSGTVRGGSGDDAIFGGRADSTFEGGSGSDFIKVNEAARIDGGSAFDTCSTIATVRVRCEATT